MKKTLVKNLRLYHGTYLSKLFFAKTLIFEIMYVYVHNYINRVLHTQTKSLYEMKFKFNTTHGGTPTCRTPCKSISYVALYDILRRRHQPFALLFSS